MSDFAHICAFPHVIFSGSGRNLEHGILEERRALIAFYA
jgi:hypothetical protein